MFAMNKKMIDQEIRQARLQQWIDKNFEGVPNKFIAMFGLNQGEIYSLLNGKRTFGERKARILEETASMPYKWLDTPLEESSIIPQHASIATIEEQEDLSAYAEVELFDVKLSAGNGTATWVARQEEPLLFRKAWLKKRGFSSEACKGMYVRGDSMEPVLQDWDTVLIDTSDKELVSGEIYAVAYKGKTFIKEIRVRPECIELVSTNAKYEPIIIPDNEAEQFQVLGRKVWRGG